MKISLSTINDLLNRSGGPVSKLTPEELTAKISSQLGAVEETINLGQKYKGVIIARVVSCEPHPNADRLHVCMIDDSGTVQSVDRNADGLVQVVCGAPNVRTGLMVAWLPPGATVPETFDKDQFVLSSKDLRGVISHGMLASPRELAIGDDHNGILEIDEPVDPGTSFATVFNLDNDVIIDIENKMFTHRPDCFGWLGVAREVAGIYGLPFTSPDWYLHARKLPATKTAELPLKLVNNLPELVPRVCLLALSDITIKPSPVRLQVELMKVGLRPINNVVDLTNYYMLLTGQPLHAYDYDKVKAASVADATIVIKHPSKNAKLKLLNGKEITPSEQAIMIATDKQLLGLAGIMGGSETEVSDQTHNIILECACFDMYAVRRSSMASGIFSDAATRFTKGQSPLQNAQVILKIADHIKQLAGGQIAGSLIDDSHLDPAVSRRDSLYPDVAVTAEFINKRLGTNLRAASIERLLSNTEFKVKVKHDSLTFTAPFWRTDIELPEDIVEEVGRLYGYDKIPLSLPRRDLEPVTPAVLLWTKSEIRRRLSRYGANEVLSYSFVPSGLLKQVGQDAHQAYEISNALRPELQYYRLSLIPSLLSKVHPNLKAGYDEFALFEIGRSHVQSLVDDEGLPAESERTALIVAKADRLKDRASAFYLAKHYLELLVGRPLRFTPLSEEHINEPMAQPFEPYRSALVKPDGSDEVLGIVGEFRENTIHGLKLPGFCAGFEVSTTLLAELLSEHTSYAPLSRFPKITQDITLKVPAQVSYRELFSALAGAITKFKADQTSFTLSPKDIYQGDDHKSKNVTFRLEVVSYERTLNDQEVNHLLEQASDTVSSYLQAERL